MSPTRFPGSPTTSWPTFNDREERYQNVSEVLISTGISTQGALFPTNGSTTPQSQALDWLLDSDPLQLLAPGTSTPSARVLQRYILSVVYYGTNGPTWNNSEAGSPIRTSAIGTVNHVWSLQSRTIQSLLQGGPGLGWET